jgi:hypothetical protein
MRRQDLEHIIRAAGEIAQDNEIVVIGSQAILAEFPAAPAELLESAEADVYPRHHQGRADDIDGGMGELSMFHERHGYYAHGVGPETVVASPNWESRLVKLGNSNTNKITGWCLEANDLFLAKLAAYRPKDLAFCKAMLRHAMVNPDTLRQRVVDMPLEPKHVDLIRRTLEAMLRTP